LEQNDFKVPLKDISEVDESFATEWDVVPFKLNAGTEISIQWPGGGIVACFEFINGNHNIKDDSYNYVRTFVLNDDTQGGAFVEHHDFPHLFFPQHDQGLGRVMLARAQSDENRKNWLHPDRFAAESQCGHSKWNAENDNGFVPEVSICTGLPQVMVPGEAENGRQSKWVNGGWKGFLEFIEIKVPFGTALLVGGNVLHADSATQGPMIATLDPEGKADSAIMKTMDFDAEQVACVTDHACVQEGASTNPFSDIQAIKQGKLTLIAAITKAKKSKDVQAAHRRRINKAAQAALQKIDSNGEVSLKSTMIALRAAEKQLVEDQVQDVHNAKNHARVS